jgi:hypothetical protein
MKNCLIFFALCFTFQAHAQLDNGLTPLERYNQGQRTQGAYSLDNWIMCSQSARAQYVSEVVDDETVLAFSPQGVAITAGGQTSLVKQVVDLTLKNLANQGDVKATGRHLCVGFYFGAPDNVTGNASSSTIGYLIFDYRAVQHLYSIQNRSFWVHHYLILHEFSHQLQYWNDDVEVAKTFQGLQSSKKPELAADCMAGALFKLNNLGLKKDLYDLSFSGVIEGATLIGDPHVNDPGHHGTPAERRFAVGFGSNMVGAMETALIDGSQKITSGELLNRCNSFVAQVLN